MQREAFQTVEISKLRPGMFVVLDIGWLAHPFPTNKFKLTQKSQIDTLRSLGLRTVQVDPARSDADAPLRDDGALSDAMSAAQESARLVAEQLAAEKAARQALERAERARLLVQQQQQLAACEKRFAHTGRVYREVVDLSSAKPLDAAHRVQDLVAGLLADMNSGGEVSIRLLSESAGEKSAQHPVNVTVISLLLARSMGLPAADQGELGVAAMTHDIGKQHVPERVRALTDGFTAAELRMYQEHVALGVQVARTMGLSANVLQAIAQHHEGHDGGGFPRRIKGAEIGALGRILSVVNRYDSLINPVRPASALTPHESLAALFSQYKNQCDPTVLSAFIRMMGVYPPGSVVQLADERYALVVAVNSSRPLKPCVVVHDPRVPRHEALMVDLERVPELSIRRSVRPQLLPAASFDYLAPRLRVNYFFEGSSEATGESEVGT